MKPAKIDKPVTSGPKKSWFAVIVICCLLFAIVYPAFTGSMRTGLIAFGIAMLILTVVVLIAWRFGSKTHSGMPVDIKVIGGDGEHP